MKTVEETKAILDNHHHKLPKSASYFFFLETTNLQRAAQDSRILFDHGFFDKVIKKNVETH